MSKKKGLLLGIPITRAVETIPDILRADFLDADPAPIDDAVLMTVGRLLKIADTGSNMSLAGHSMAASTGPSTWVDCTYAFDNGSAQYARAAGRTLMATWRRGNTGSAMIGLYPDLVIDAEPVFGIKLGSTFAPQQGAITGSPIAATASVGYGFWLVQRANDALLFYLDDLEAAPKLIYVFDNTGATALTPGVANYNQDMRIGSMRMRDLTGVFADADGFETDHKTGLLSLGQTFDAEANCEFSFVVGSLPTGGAVDVAFRYVDDANHLKVRVQSDGKMRVMSMTTADGELTIAQTAVSVAGVGTVVHVRAEGTTIQVSTSTYGGAISTTSPLFTTETGGKVMSLGSGGTISNLVTHRTALTETEVDALLDMLKTDTVYVDTVAGHDANGGFAADDAFATVLAAKTALDNATVVPRGTISIVAPEDTPVVFDAWTVSRGHYTLTGDDFWFGAGAGNVYTDGWTDDGGGVYHRAYTVQPYVMFAPSMTEEIDGVEFRVMLARTTGTETAPAAGEFGLSGGNLYIHLPGDANANNEIVRHPLKTITLRVNYNAHLTIDWGRIYYSNSMGFSLLDNARINLNYTIVAYGYNSGVTSGTVSGATNVFTATQCEFTRHLTNDGINAQIGFFYLIDCWCHHNGDEGASPHLEGYLDILLGTFEYNGSGGITAVNFSECHINGALVQYNFQEDDGDGALEGAVTFKEANPSGSISNCLIRFNAGHGIWVDTLGSVTLENNQSGVENGNLYEDYVP